MGAIGVFDAKGCFRSYYTIVEFLPVLVLSKIVLKYCFQDVPHRTI